MPPPETHPLSVERLLETERIVGYRPCFASAFGGVACAVLLSQFWFWTGTPTVRARGGWFWKTQQEITEETGLTRKEIESSRRKLRALGVLYEERHGVPATMHYRLNTDVLRQRLQEHQAQENPKGAVPAQFARMRRTELPRQGKPFRPMQTNKCSQIGQSTTETTTETTQEKTQTPEVLPAAWEIPERQQQVNRQGVARFKAALDAARAGTSPPSGRNPPGKR